MQKGAAAEADAVKMLLACAQQGRRQIVWTNDFVAVSAIVGTMRNLCVYSWDILGAASAQRWESLLRRGLPLQLVKDIVSLAAIYNCGGVYADMKILFLPHNPLRREPGLVLLGCEPVKTYSRTPTRTRSMEHVGGRTCLAQLWLGFFAAPPRHRCLKELQQRLEQHWLNSTLDFTTVPWGNTPMWMENTRRWHEQWAGCSKATQHLLPYMVCPWPAWLQKAASLGNEVFKYYNPTIAEVAETSAAVCFWQRQWAQPLREELWTMLHAHLQQLPRHSLWQQLRDRRDAATARLEQTAAPMLQSLFAPERRSYHWIRFQTRLCSSSVLSCRVTNLQTSFGPRGALLVGSARFLTGSV